MTTVELLPPPDGPGVAGPDEMAAVLEALAANAYLVADEAKLQARLADALTAAGITAEREVRLSARDRVDFLTEAGIAVEIKVAGSHVAVLSQAYRYAEHPHVRGIVVATTVAKHLGMPATLDGKPLAVLFLDGLGTAW